jgi:hypothetical protein
MGHLPRSAATQAKEAEWRWWQWPTILSLDAPAVALLWQWLLARSANVTLHAHHAYILGASVWLSYAADRWIEGLRLREVFTARHLFYQRWRWPVAVIWLAVLISDVGIAIARLSAAEFSAGLTLLALVLTYLISHQLIHRHHGWRAPKEVCVALLLGGGVALFPLMQSPTSVRLLMLPLALFMLLCFVNCVLISAWEREIDEWHGQTSIALQFRRGIAFGIAVPWVLAAFAALLAVKAGDQARSASFCALASSVSLGTVNVLEPRLGRRLARVLADVALMTPLVPLLLSLPR